jgi:hypothetical protein
MAMIKITHRQLERLILEVSSDGPVIDLKNPEFWYQDAVNPAMGKVFGWLKKNIHKKSGTLNLEETWPYPVSPEAIDEYDVGSTYYEIDVEIMETPFQEGHPGWNLSGGAVDRGHANGIDIILELDPDLEISEELLEEIEDDLLDTLAHEIHHMTQWGALERLNCPIYANINGNNDFEYFRQCDEKPAFIIGFRARASRKNTTVEQLMKDYLQNYVNVGRITEKQAEEVLRDWLDYEF